jgi:hypothetical protein
MDEKRTVGLYGNNLVLSAIGTSLQGKFQVHQLEQLLPETVETAGASYPDVILFDLATAPADLALALLRRRPMLTLVGVDIENNKMVALSRETCFRRSREDAGVKHGFCRSRSASAE